MGREQQDCNCMGREQPDCDWMGLVKIQRLSEPDRPETSLGFISSGLL
jgi:hypothetical protein